MLSPVISRRSVTSALLALAAAPLWLVALGAPAHADEGPTSAFSPVRPCRLLDTRTGSPGRLGARAEVTIQVTGRCGVPGGASAVALNVVAVLPSAYGHVTAWPDGERRPDTSMLNYAKGDVRANSVLLRVGDGGRVRLSTHAAADLVVDVTGYFTPADAARAGRFVPLQPERLVDTRQTSRPRRGGVVRVEADVPADAVAVAINVVTTETTGPDFLTAYPAGTDLPLASTLNVDRPGQTRAAAGVIGVTDGAFNVYTHTGNHVIVDITGYFTGPSAQRSGDGLFVPADPVRLIDTRRANGKFGGPRLWENGGREFDPFDVTGGPVAALAANWTMTDTEDAGWVLAYPAGNSFGEVSTVNASGPRQSAATSAITPVSERGIGVHASEGTELVVDVLGWFTGDPLDAPHAADLRNAPPARRVTLISDSAMAGVRWNGALGGLQGSNLVFEARLESCRRLVQFSCRGREGYAPRTAAAEIAALPAPGPNDILVIATGYNDWHERFASDFDVVVDAARRRGFHHIAWVAYRTGVGYHLPGSGASSNYAAMNAVIYSRTSLPEYSDVRVWDLDEYTAGSSGWFRSDGVHHTTLGSWAVADWISRQAAAFDDRTCVHPWTPGGKVENPCPDPDPLPADRGHPDIAALYGL